MSVKKLNKRHLKFLHMKFIRKMTYRKIAELEGLSVSRARQIVCRAVLELQYGFKTI